MSILEWTFAYTGFIECVETNGEVWNTVPTEGPCFNELQNRLAFETTGGNIIDFTAPVQQETEETNTSGGKFFGFFGKK